MITLKKYINENLSAYITEEMQKIDDLYTFSGCNSINSVLSKLKTARKKSKELLKIIDDFDKKMKSESDATKWNALHNELEKIFKQYDAWGREIWNHYCGYLNLYDWSNLTTNDFTKIDANTDQWNETIDNLIYVRKNNKNPQIALFADKNNEFKFIIVRSALYDLNFDRNRENDFGYRYHTGCVAIQRYKNSNFAQSYSSNGEFSKSDIKSILSEYDMYVAKQPEYDWQQYL